MEKIYVSGEFEKAKKAEDAVGQAERGVEHLLNHEGPELSAVEEDLILQHGTEEEKRRLAERNQSK